MRFKFQNPTGLEVERSEVGKTDCSNCDIVATVMKCQLL